jgi:hypothetical protein
MNEIVIVPDETVVRHWPRRLDCVDVGAGEGCGEKGVCGAGCTCVVVGVCGPHPIATLHAKIAGTIRRKAALLFPM